MEIKAIQTSDSSKKNIIIRRVWLAAVILVFAILQNTQGWFPSFFGVRALILIPLVSAIAMYERDIAGIFFGLFAGALWDTVAKGGDFNAIYLVIVGFACGTLINTIMRNNFVTHLILSSVATVFYELGYWIWHFVVGKLDRSVFMLFRFYIPSAIYTVLLSVPIFLLVRAIENKYREKDSLLS